MASVDENNKAEEFELPDEKVDELENFFNLISYLRSLEI